MNEIRIVTIIGSNGAMGSSVAGIIASFGCATVFMIARTIEKAEESIVAAMQTVRSESIRDRMVAKTYDDLGECVSKSDWVFESVAENFELKLTINHRIAQYCSATTIISTGTSGLSVKKLSEAFPLELRSNYFGTHFYNPPYRMTLCELVMSDYSAKPLSVELKTYLERILLRKVVLVIDCPAFAGNRVGFQFINEALLKAEVEMNRGGVDYIDSLLGSYTGRAMPPLKTIDFVGLDIHKAIVENVYNNSSDSLKKTFVLPKFIDELINAGNMGVKTGGGLYKYDMVGGVKKQYVYDIKTSQYRLAKNYSFKFADDMKELLQSSEYEKAYTVLLEDRSYEASIIKHSILRYVSYSLMMVGTVVKTKDDIDVVMMAGYNWSPPSVFVDLFGGVDNTIDLMREYGVDTPSVLTGVVDRGPFYTLQDSFDYRRYFRSK